MAKTRLRDRLKKLLGTTAKAALLIYVVGGGCNDLHPTYDTGQIHDIQRASRVNSPPPKVTADLLRTLSSAACVAESAWYGRGSKQYQNNLGLNLTSGDFDSFGYYPDGTNLVQYTGWAHAYSSERLVFLLSAEETHINPLGKFGLRAIAAYDRDLHKIIIALPGTTTNNPDVTVPDLIEGYQAWRGQFNGLLHDTVAFTRLVEEKFAPHYPGAEILLAGYSSGTVPVMGAAILLNKPALVIEARGASPAFFDNLKSASYDPVIGQASNLPKLPVAEMIRRYDQNITSLSTAPYTAWTYGIQPQRHFQIKPSHFDTSLERTDLLNGFIVTSPRHKLSFFYQPDPSTVTAAKDAPASFIAATQDYLAWRQRDNQRIAMLNQEYGIESGDYHSNSSFAALTSLAKFALALDNSITKPDGTIDSSTSQASTMSIGSFSANSPATETTFTGIGTLMLPPPRQTATAPTVNLVITPTQPISGGWQAQPPISLTSFASPAMMAP